jgi:DNA-binding NarL/FixJ family response regulator
VRRMAALAAEMHRVPARSRRDTGVAFRFRDQQAWVDAAVAGARAQLGDAASDEQAEQGSTMSTDDVPTLAHRGRGPRRRPPSGWDALTPTERQVVDLVVAGLTNPQIGSRLVMSRATVKTHLSHCLIKLGMASRSEMAAAADRRSGEMRS